MESGSTESCVFVEYGENFDPLVEWCTAPELCADRLVSDQIFRRSINGGLYVW